MVIDDEMFIGTWQWNSSPLSNVQVCQITNKISPMALEPLNLLVFWSNTFILKIIWNARFKTMMCCNSLSWEICINRLSDGFYIANLEILMILMTYWFIQILIITYYTHAFNTHDNRIINTDDLYHKIARVSFVIHQTWYTCIFSSEF